MIDTIYLYQDYNRIPSGFQKKLYTIGNDVVNEGWILNTPHFNADYKQGKIYIHYEVSKLNGLDCISSSIDDFRDSVDNLNDYILPIYTDFRFDKKLLRVGRLDIFKNIKIENRYGFISNVGLFIGGSNRGGLTFDRGTLRIGRTKQWAVYDKSSQILQVRGVDIGESVVRSEVRFTKSRTIGSVFNGMSWNSISSLPPSAFMSNYNKVILKYLGGGSVPMERYVVINYIDEGVLRDIRRFQKYAAGKLIEEMGGVYNVLNTLYFNESPTDRYRKKLVLGEDLELYKGIVNNSPKVDITQELLF